MAVEHTKAGFFKQDVLDSKLPVLVDFWADWCAPCRMISPILEKVSDGYEGKLNFYKLNVDHERAISQDYNIQSIPCLIMFYKGKEIGRIVGALSESMLKEKIDALLAKTKK